MRATSFQAIPRILERLELVAMIDVLLSRAKRGQVVEPALDTMWRVFESRSSVEGVVLERPIRDADGLVQHTAAEPVHGVEEFGFLDVSDVKFFRPWMIEISSVRLTYPQLPSPTYENLVVGILQ